MAKQKCRITRIGTASRESNCTDRKYVAKTDQMYPIAGGFSLGLDEAIMEIWQAWGLIAAETLPATNLYLNDDITIEPLSEDRKAALLREPGQLEHILWQSPVYFSGIYGQIIVRSSHAIWFRVRAEERSEAEAAIYLDLLPSVLAALSCLSNQMPPRVEMM